MGDEGDSRARPLSALAVLVLLSGFSGLVFELVWIRALGRYFGTTAPAIATVVAVFMAGLAAGNALFGRRADESPRPLVLYARIELGIGVAGLLASLLLLQGDEVLEGVARWAGSLGALDGPARVLVVGAVLLVPTALMGGTLPVLARASIRSEGAGRIVGLLYALNTTGAVLGALAPDLLLVPRFGLTTTALLAAAGNGVVALGAAWLARGRAARRVAAATHQPAAAGGVAKRAALLYGVSGFCAMGVQVLWSRTLEHLTSGWITSFSTLLALFLAALAAGSGLASTLADRVRHPLRWAAGALVAIGPAVLVPIHFVADWWTLQRHLHPLGPVTRPSPGHVFVDALQHSLYLELVPCLLMGAALPFLAAAVVRQGEVGRQTGRLYAINTLAGVAGALTTGFLWLPGWGQQASFAALASLATATGTCALALESRGRSPAFALALTALALVLSLGWLAPPDRLQRAFFPPGRGEILAVYEGSTTTAAAVRHREFGQPSVFELKTPGVSMSSSRFAARRYMGLLAHIGVFFSGGAERALLICYGIGNTARSLLAHPDLERLDVVDLADEVLDASPRFAPVHGFDPLESPRAHVFVEDGRHHLVTTDERYDVITSEPPPPNHAGVVNLYSREYYRLAKRRLRPGGVLTQWLPVFQLSREDNEAMVAAFVAEFPHTALFYGHGHQWILAGSDAPLRIDLPAWRARAEQPAVAADLAASGIDRVVELVASFVQTDEGLRAVAERRAPLSDDRPSIQYPDRALAGIEVPAGLTGDPRDVRALIVPSGAGDADLDAGLRAMAAVLRALPWQATPAMESRELFFGARVQRALAQRRSNAVMALLGLSAEHVARARRADGLGQAGPASRMVAVRVAFYGGRYAEALAALRASVPAPETAAHYWLLRAGCEHALGNAEAAEVAYLEAAAASRSSVFAAHARALAEGVSQPVDPARGPFASAVSP